MATLAPENTSKVREFCGDRKFEEAKVLFTYATVYEESASSDNLPRCESKKLANEAGDENFSTEIDLGSFPLS